MICGEWRAAEEAAREGDNVGEEPGLDSVRGSRTQCHQMRPFFISS